MTAKLSRLLCAILSLLLLSSILTPIALANNGDVIVYVTDTGTVYHRKGCTYLQSQRTITLSYAVSRGYTPCTRCDPAILGTPKSTDNDPYEPPPYKPHTPGNSSDNDNISTLPSEAENNSYHTKKPVNIGFFGNALIVLFFGFIAVCTIGPFIFWGVTAFVEIKKSHKDAIQQRADYNRLRAELLKKYAGKSLDDFALIPTGVTFDQYGKPQGTGHGKWGRDYTFYRSKSGKTYHSKSTCTKGATIPIHAMDIRSYSPCKRCKPILPDLSWYYERERIKSECRYYGITIPEHPLQIQALQQTAHAENEQLRLF